jgi:hypothetical protein
MENKNTKRQIYLTGKTQETMNSNPSLCCYICKREKGDDSVFIENSNVDVIPEIKLSWYIVGTATYELHYLLCLDCFLLIDNFRNEIGDVVEEKIVDSLKPSQS